MTELAVNTARIARDRALELLSAEHRLHYDKDTWEAHLKHVDRRCEVCLMLAEHGKLPE